MLATALGVESARGFVELRTYSGYLGAVFGLLFLALDLFALLALLIGVQLLRRRRWAPIAHLVAVGGYGVCGVAQITTSLSCIRRGGCDRHFSAKGALLYISAADDYRNLAIATLVLALLLGSAILTLLALADRPRVR